MRYPTVSISSVRNNLAELMEQVSAQQQPITITQHSLPKAVLVDYDYYEALEEAILDLTDAREADKAKKEPTLSLKNYIAKRWS